MKIMVGTPYFGPYDKEHFDCVMKLGNADLAPHDVDLHQVRDCPYIDQAKSIIATRALELGFDVVVIVDHDMIFEPEDIVQVAQAAMDQQAVVGAAYGARARGAKRPVAYCDLPVTFFEGGAVVPATIVAGGFMAIPASALLRIIEFFSMGRAQVHSDYMAFPLFHCRVSDGKWWGEDISFCQRAKEAGVGLFLDTRLRIGHKGTYVYQIEDGILAVPRLPSVEIRPQEPGDEQK